MKHTKNPGKNKRKRQQPLMQVDRGTVDSQASMHLKVVAELNQFELDMQDTLAGVRDEILQEFREELEKRIDEMKTDMDDLQSQRLHSAMETLRHKLFGGEAFAVHGKRRTLEQGAYCLLARKRARTAPQQP
jgi:hypothetical protein